MAMGFSMGTQGAKEMEQWIRNPKGDPLHLSPAEVLLSDRASRMGLGGGWRVIAMSLVHLQDRGLLGIPLTTAWVKCAVGSQEMQAEEECTITDAGGVLPRSSLPAVISSQLHPPREIRLQLAIPGRGCHVPQHPGADPRQGPTDPETLVSRKSRSGAHQTSPWDRLRPDVSWNHLPRSFPCPILFPYLLAVFFPETTFSVNDWRKNAS